VLLNALLALLDPTLMLLVPLTTSNATANVLLVSPLIKSSASTETEVFAVLAPLVLTMLKALVDANLALLELSNPELLKPLA
jgi:hypothetical protein